ncbi:hypothetical protein CG428_08840 [Pantoea ananatis]|uniref:hypothetical protein n=1 Tax=Pantoea ananas TaxID=553 RepID=UPI000CF43249|nr:hypothetical protein [Pantoea ananatis]PQK77165.1 hypothetical protein CG428_08840 [Pantoea ananatis]
MSNYSFSLTPYNNFVKGLCSIHSNDFSIVDDSDSDLGQTDVHILSSIHMNVIEDINELKTKLKGLLMLMNGALSVIYGFERFNTLGHLSINGSEGVNYHEIDGFKSMDITQTNPFSKSHIQNTHEKACAFSKLINLSSKVESLRIILGMCALGSDWVNLYRIWETVTQFYYEEYSQGEMLSNGKPRKKINKNDLMAIELNIEKNEVSRFTGTVNSFEMLGYLSRHGKGSVSHIIRNPMERLDASNLVRQACVIYCNNHLRRAS